MKRFHMTRRILFAVVILCALMGPVVSAPMAETRDDDLVSVNLADVEITSIVRIMSEITGKNFIYDEGLKGKITVIAPVKLSSSEAFSLFISALELKNFAVVPAGKAYKILPSSQARQSAARVVKGLGKVKVKETFIVRLIPLDYVSTQEAFAFVQPLVSRFGQLSVFGSRNALLIVDSALNTDKIVDIIKSIDTPPPASKPEVVYLKHAKADMVAGMLKTEVAKGAIAGKRTNAKAGDGITADLRLNAVILSGPLNIRKSLKEFIGILDVASPETSGRINVYYLENADAVKLSAVLEKLTKPAAGAARKESGSRVLITPDPDTNALIIRAAPTDYNELVQIIKKLDRRPKQVFVEAMIMEVSVDKALALGTKWRVMGIHNNEPLAVGGFGNVDQSAIQTILSGIAGASIGGLGNFVTVPVTSADGTTFNLTAPGFAALFSMSEFKDVVNVLSTPHLLTSDNSEAEIIVGENVPFLSKIERESGSISQPLLQSIERKDVGIKLNIKPKISEGGFVKLDLYQEISSIATTTTVGAADLITTKRSAKTTVVVKDRQTVVIGGLIQNKVTKSNNRVPLMSRIPIIGWLFKNKSDITEKTNLLVFITPYIIDEFGELEYLKERKKREFFGEKIGMERFGDEADVGTLKGRSVGPLSPAPAPEAGAAKELGVNSPRVYAKTLAVPVPAEAEVAAAADGGPAAIASPAPTSVYDIVAVRTGLHDDFHRLVVELSGEPEYSIVRNAEDRLSINIRGVGAVSNLVADLSTDIIKVKGLSVVETPRGPVATLDIEFAEGSRPEDSTRQNPFRIVIDFHR
jgi:general secretion pathway protein D